MSKKQKSTTNQTVTSTPTNPQFAQAPTEALSGQIQSLAGQNPQSFVAGPQGLNTQAFDLFGQIGGQAPGWLNQAANTNTGYNPATMQAAQVGDAAQANAATAAQNMGSYFNPFLSQVAGNTVADMGRGLQLAQNTHGQGANLAGQYGGSRQGVLDANVTRDYFDRMGSTLGNLYAQGFNTAAGFGDADANRQTGTSQFNAGQSNAITMLQAQLDQQANASNQDAQNSAWQFGANQGMQKAGLLANMGQFGLGGLLDAGGTQQQLAQQQAQAPLSLLQLLTQANGAQPYGLFNGSTQNINGTTTQKGSFLDGVGKIAQIGANAASLFSDVRLKQDVRPAGTDARGRNWYDYRYIWDAPGTVRRGVLAHEVAEHEPGAVGLHPSGFLMVDYAKLEG